MKPKSSLIFLILITLASSPQFLLAAFQEDYSTAYKAFENAKSDADKRVVADNFIELSKRSDAGPLKGNTLYWAAECWYSTKEYMKALSGFERVLLLPGSNKEEDARFKVAYCYMRLGWNDAAKWELQRFLKDFPSSRHVNRIQNALKELP